MNEIEQFDHQLPQLIVAWSTAMRCGYSILQVVEATAQMTRTNQPFDPQAECSALQAVESVTYENVNPATAQFGQVWQEFQSGVAMLTALDNLYERMPSDVWKMILDTIKAHREVGGNLADILEVLGMVLSKRQGE